MDLTIQEVTQYLQVPEERVMKWISDEEIPSYKLNNEYRFSRVEIEEWMLRHLNQEDLEIDIDHKEQVGLQQFSLYRALHKGFVLHDVEGNTKEEIIRSSMTLISEHLDLDADVISNLLLEREKLMSTALNRGVALPHTRDFLLSNTYDAVAIVYPKKPIEYGALDGKKVHTLFFLFACNDKRHLNLLAKIAFFCHQNEHLEFLKSKSDKQTLLHIIKHWEAGISQLEPA